MVANPKFWLVVLTIAFLIAASFDLANYLLDAQTVQLVGRLR